MRLLIAAVGRLKQGPEQDLFVHYIARAEAAGRKLGLGPFTSIDISESRKATVPLRLAAEAASLLAKCGAAQIAICLDPKGRELSSEKFAETLGKYRDGGAPGLAFLIGGADGLGEEALSKADLRLSLGPMILPHGLARIVLAEQIYRAATILAGHPYHRG
ncbi:MAG TPA: 23S rRNA (pseudouridine(1915)-N(3))-methyltransferase RlmH [Methyloceanibacter sp.]|jgi:23S rRNA (pseudouridine1915-N3)-methyltransferase